MHRKASQFVSAGRRRLVSIVRLLCAVLVLQLHIGFVTAQQNMVKPDQQVQSAPPDLLTQENAASKEIKEKREQSFGEAAFPETQKIRDAREEYILFTFKNIRDAFDWQAISTKVIFMVVILVVMGGLYLSWMQFNYAHKVPLTKITEIKKGNVDKGKAEDQKDQENKEKANDNIDSSTIEVSTSGVKITSSVVGLVILTLSIVFFFLYLQFVYPIKVLPTTGAEPAGAKKEAKQ